MSKWTPSRWLVALVVGLIVLATTGQPTLAQETPGDNTPGVTVHIVQSGETLFEIAARHNTTIEAIQQANSLSNPDDITVGQRLIIPGTGSTLAGMSDRVIVVGMGDTVYTLAARYGVSPERLGALNQVVNPALLYAGQIFDIPAADGPERQESTNLLCLSGEDSLWRVALRNNSNITALALSNDITNPVVAAPRYTLTMPGESGSGMLLPEPWDSIVLHPLPLEQGRSGGMRVTTNVGGTLQGTFLATNFNFVSDGISHHVILGVDRWTAPGLYPMTLSLQDGTGTVWTFSKQVLITSGGYAQEEISLPPDVAAVLNDPLIVQQEFSYIAQSMSGFTPERHWDGLFMLPAAGVMTSAFGTARSYNGSGYNSFHAGTDLAGPTGTPIYAPADGTVVDTGSLHVRGYVTIIDHGWGVYTGYWHQSSILVQPGEIVEAGQQIGTIGSTGLSTAAHLHWEMWVGGVRVDPLQWVREVFP